MLPDAQVTEINMTTITTLRLTASLSPTVLVALRLVPLLSTTASLTHAYMEWLTNSSFLGSAPVDSSLSQFLTSPPASLTTGSSETAKQDIEAAKQLVVPEWFTSFFNTGVLSVVGLNSLTLISAVSNLLVSEGLQESKVFYQAGLVAAVGHYAFVPIVAPSISALIGMAALQRKGVEVEITGVGKGAVEWIGEWVGWHKVRMSTVDVVAWGCFAWGAIHTLAVTK